MKIFFILEFIGFYLFKLVQANLIIARDILTPGTKIKPAFLEVPVTIRSNSGLLLFSNLLSMTPGTLSIDIIKNKEFVLVHILFYSSETSALAEFEYFQRKIKRIVG